MSELTSEHQPSWNKRDAVFLTVCAVFIYLHVFLLPATPIFYEEDHLMFVNDAWRMYLGEAIYRDFFQLVFPGTQSLYLGLLYVFGPAFWIIGAVIVAQGTAQALIWLAIAKRIFGNTWFTYLPSSIFIFFGFRWFGIDGSHRMLSPVFIGLAILVLLKFRGWLGVWLAGICCAFATFFTQQRGFLVVIAVGSFLAIEAYRNRSGWKRLVLHEAFLAGTFLCFSALLISPFLVSAGPERFFDDTFFFLRNYVQGSVANSYSAFFDALSTVFAQGFLMSSVTLFYYALVPLVYIVALIYMIKRKYDSALLLICLVGFLLAFGSVVPVPGRVFQTALPAVTVFCWLLARMVPNSKTIARYAVCLLMLFGLTLAVRTQLWQPYYLDSPTGRIAFLSPVVYERYGWLSENARKGDYVFETYQPSVNFPLQLRNPTSMLLVWDNAFTPAFQVTETVESLRKNPPRFIIWDGKWSKEPAERSPDDNLAPLYEYLKLNYRLENEFTPYSNRKMELWQQK